MNRSWKALLKAYLTGMCSTATSDGCLSGFNGSLRSLHEPSIEQTLRRAAPYIHHSFEGEAVLSVGKAIDYINRGVSGIVNVMPFTCMPGHDRDGRAEARARRPRQYSAAEHRL